MKSDCIIFLAGGNFYPGLVSLLPAAEKKRHFWPQISNRVPDPKAPAISIVMPVILRIYREVESPDPALPSAPLNG